MTDNPAPWVSAGVLREADRRLWFVKRSEIEATMAAASWRCGFLREETFVCCAWTWLEAPGVGWVGLLAGLGMDEGPRVELGRLITVADAEMKRACRADVLWTWVRHDDERAKKFAERFGLAYECGPACGFGPDGGDYDLHAWRR